MRYVLREKLISIGEDFTITDDRGHPVFIVDQKLLHIRDELHVLDMQGKELAKIQRKLISLRPVYEIWRDGRQLAVVRRAFIRILRDKFDVDVPGPDDLEIQGDFINHNYAFTRHGQTVANVTKAWISLTDTYGVDIQDGEDDVLILACAVVIERVNDMDEDHAKVDK